MGDDLVELLAGGLTGQDQTMRWINLEDFSGGESCPYDSPRVGVLRKFEAVPLDEAPFRTYLFDPGGWKKWSRLRGRREEVVSGCAWVRRRALYLRRAAWSVWGLILIATGVAAFFPDYFDERTGQDYFGFIAVLLIVALVLARYRIRAILDVSHGEVGIVGG